MTTAQSFAPFLAGPRLYLREVRPADANENYYRWMNDPEITRYLESRFVPHSLEGLREYISKLLGDRGTIFLAIVLAEGHRHIGNIKLGPVDWIHRRGEIGILIGEKDCWGHGYATEAISILADYAFRRLNLHKITAGCYQANEGSARAFEKAGFVREGLAREHFYCDGSYVDAILLGRVREDEPARRVREDAPARPAS